MEHIIMRSLPTQYRMWHRCGRHDGIAIKRSITTPLQLMMIAFHLAMLLPSSGVFTLLILSITTPSASALNLSPRRQFWTSLRSSVDDEPPEATGGATTRGDNDEETFTRFERVVRKVTGNKEYKFGDITRSVANATTSVVEGTVRTVTKNDDYQFGDIAKTVIGSTTHGIEDVVKTVTGNEEYQFGDLTRGTVRAAGNVLTYSEKALGALRDANIHELIDIFDLYWTKSMDAKDRDEAFTVAVYSGAIVILAYNFLANVMSGTVFAAAWVKTSAEAGVSPLSVGMWSKFLETKSTLDIFFGGPCLPARALLSIPFFFKYRKFVVGISRHSPLRNQFPIINRYASLILSWVVANLAFVSCVTALMVKIGSLCTGVPIFPVA